MLPTLLFNLLSGLKLVMFRPLDRIGFRYTMSAFWSIVCLNFVVTMGLQRARIGEMVIFQPEGLYPEALFILLVLLASFLMNRFLETRVLQFRFPVMFLSAALWVQLISSAAQALVAGWSIGWAVYWLLQLWLLLIISRTLSLAARADRKENLLRRWVATMAFAITVQLVGYMLYPFEFWRPAPQVQAEVSATEAVVFLDAEAILTSQPALLQQQLQRLEPSVSGTINAYFIGYAPWGDQQVFSNEIRFARSLFDTDHGTGNRSLSLINDVATVGAQPLAIASNLAATLQWLRKIAQPEEDILFLFVTSHGEENHDIGTVLANLPLNNLPAAGLATLVEESGFRWKVIIVSSCYSGGHIPLLADETTMVITASRLDRTSFGCTDDAEYTYFGRAFMIEALTETRNFRTAFEKARQTVAEREAEEGFEPSEPQIAIGEAIERYLEENYR